MAKAQTHKGTTSKLYEVFIRDSSSTTGAGLAGLVFNTASLTAYYYREGAATATAITLVTMTVGTWASGGFVAIDGTNLPGVYQLGIPDLALATGANSVLIMLKGATNMAPLLLEIQLTDTDVNDPLAFGLSRIDAAISSRLAAASITLAAGAVTVGTNNDKTGYSLSANAVDAAQFTQAAADKVWATSVRTLTAFAQGFSDQVWSSATRTLTAISSAILGGTWDALRSGHTTVGSFGEGIASVQGSVTGSVGSVTGNLGGNVVGSVNSVVTAVDILQTAADKVWATTARTLTAFAQGFADQVWLSAARTLTAISSAILGGTWDALRSGHTTVGSFGEGVASVQGAVTGAVGSVTAPVVAGTVSDKTGYALTVAEETAIAQALLKLDWTGLTGEASHSVLSALRFLRNHWTLVGTTLTVYKEDGTTVAWTAVVTATAGASPVTASSG